MFDKSRGPGGRPATRRVEWVDRLGQTCTTRLDHGAVGITARTAPSQAFVDEALGAGGLAQWTPALAAGSLSSEDGERFYVPLPDMPSLCRRQLVGAAATGSFAVDGLHKDSLGWQVQAGRERHPEPFDAVVLALPQVQAAALLGQHRSDWAQHASIAPMQPCWTLMGVADTSKDALEPTPGWDLARPPTGPLDWVPRNDARPGRARVSGQAHWVVHARSGWSRRHLEQPAAWVQQQLHAALVDFLGRPVDWHHCAVHRWRFALPHSQKIAAAESFWWDAAQGLGVCGDFLGGSGVEGPGCPRNRCPRRCCCADPARGNRPLHPPLMKRRFERSGTSPLDRHFISSRHPPKEFQMNLPLPRRVFLMTLAAAGAALATHSQAQTLVDAKDPQAAALGYVADAKRVDVKKYPKFVAGQNCASCALYQGKAADKAGGCPLFAGKQVASAGWCSAWAKKA